MTVEVRLVISRFFQEGFMLVLALQPSHLLCPSLCSSAAPVPLLSTVFHLPLQSQSVLHLFQSSLVVRPQRKMDGRPYLEPS